MPQFPTFFGGVAQGVQSGFQLGLMKQERDAEEADQAADLASIKAVQDVVNQTTGQEVKQNQSRQQALGTLQTLGDLVKLPKDIRKPQVDAFVQSVEAQTGTKLADNFKQMLRTGNPETLSTLVGEIQRTAISNPEMDSEALLATLSSPVRVAKGAGDLFKVAQFREQTGGGEQPAAPTPQAQAQHQLKQLRQRQQALLQVATRFAGRPGAKGAQTQLNVIQDDINRLERLLQTGVEAGMREAGQIQTRAQMTPQIASIEQAQARGTEIGQAQGEFATRDIRAETAATREAAVTAARETTESALADRARLPNALARAAGMSPGITVGQFKEQGGSVPDATTTRNLFQSRAATEKSLQLGSRMINMVAGRPELLSTAGGLARFADSLVEQSVGIARAFNQDFDPKTLEVSTYEDTLKDVGIDSAELQSAIVGLSFAAAQASGQDGRSVSDRDVERFIRRIGANTGSSAQFTNTLFSFLEDIDKGHRARVEANTGIDPGPSSLATMPTEELLQIDPNQLSSAELELLEKRVQFLERRSK